jgi:Flp pilus assembly protein TadG
MVEMALTLPLFFLLILGLIEFGQAMMVQQVVTNAAREGARHGVLPGVSTAAAKQKVKDYLAAEDLDVPQATITVTPAELSTAKTGSVVSVNVSIPYSAIGWVNNPWFVGGAALKSQCTMRHE